VEPPQKQLNIQKYATASVEDRWLRFVALGFRRIPAKPLGQWIAFARASRSLRGSDSQRAGDGFAGLLVDFSRSSSVA
jgi:hypothetical protein